MKPEKINDLIDQINKVILILEEDFKKNNEPMVELIIKRYKNAKDMLENTPQESLKRVLFKIDGGVRAYLEVSSDYMNPLLDELHKAEKLLDEFFS
ncbi:hypothetical protein [Pseudobacteroides cellulosolvens]|uniref:Uncharacterized protein n=1 Tax=Pseudobacteroides cellulosolvens ATCC 35603 = DSM 2933 TaxID=398512 RepID=A0A0L6JYM8_9FIRM|nr:hypothetical protein [Pseudobacteroides cellulosolvens]KNY30550.1 hypothetical protein Bccel_5830 [Pseudobacteroides cellulosolvens ATCC 35603 = DSM 2933]KNY30567.1 hypothetical protein Bccel_5847 [Pseudobacteroides cellulosolvens ATCC 35603 = DSM 2933]